jgi:subtilase family serine protease
MDNDIRLSRGVGFISVFLPLLFSATWAIAQQSSPDALPPIYVRGDAQKGSNGFTPQQIRHAYGFDRIPNHGEGQVIGLVEAYNNPQIEKDLGVFSEAFGLPDCTTRNGCFQKVVVGKGNPGTNTLWALEIALDVEWAHAIAPNAQILLVESQSAKLVDMLQAVDVAVQSGATVVSMSWGTYEFPTELAYDGHFLANIPFVAASGDFGDPGFYPAASPFVTGVGGTTLTLDSNGNYAGETAWSTSGGGISTVATEPAYQTPFQSSGMRGVPDVAYNADPNSGFAVYDSTPYHGFVGWIQVGGTSAAAPQWAALIAIANSMRVQAHKLPLTRVNDALYNAASPGLYAADYNDIKKGTNGPITCGTVCWAGSGYDFITGLGTPRAASLIPALQN